MKPHGAGRSRWLTALSLVYCCTQYSSLRVFERRYKWRHNSPGVCTSMYWVMRVWSETTNVSDTVGSVCISSNVMFPIYTYGKKRTQDQYTCDRTNKTDLFIYTQLNCRGNSIFLWPNWPWSYDPQFQGHRLFWEDVVELFLCSLRQVSFRINMPINFILVITLFQFNVEKLWNKFVWAKILARSERYESWN